MQQIVKQVLQLSSSSEVAKWKEVETAIKPKELNTTEIAQLAEHFAAAQQGSEQFWEALQRAAVEKLDNFNRDDLTTLFSAMMNHPYDVDGDVGTAISGGMDLFFEAEVKEQKKKDPYFISNFVNYIQAGLGPYALKAGPGYYQSKFNEEVESEGEEDDVDLAHQSNHEDKFALFEMNSEVKVPDNVQEQAFEEIEKIIAKDISAQDLQSMK